MPLQQADQTRLEERSLFLIFYEEYIQDLIL
jgi:hypothetical protein